MTYEHTCARGHEWVSIHADSSCFQCEEIDTAIAKGRPKCAADDCDNLVTASDQAFEAGQRFCRAHAYGNFMEQQEVKFAPLLNPFRERGYKAEVLQTGGFVMLPVVWLDEHYRNTIGISHEASDCWSVVTYLDYSEGGELWKDPTGVPVDIPNGDHDTLENLTQIVTEVMSYIDDGRLKADLDVMRAERYDELVLQIGKGFHPDTAGADYTNLPQYVTAEMVDRIVADAIAAGVDVYAVALDLLTNNDNQEG